MSTTFGSAPSVAGPDWITENLPSVENSKVNSDIMTIALSLNKEVGEELDNLAQKYGMSRPSFIRLALAKGIEDGGGTPHQSLYKTHRYSTRAKND